MNIYIYICVLETIWDISINYRNVNLGGNNVILSLNMDQFNWPMDLGAFPCTIVGTNRSIIVRVIY